MQRSQGVIGTALCAITNGEINHDPDQTIVTAVCARAGEIRGGPVFRVAAMQLTSGFRVCKIYIRIYVGA